MITPECRKWLRPVSLLDLLPGNKLQMEENKRYVWPGKARGKAKWRPVNNEAP